jgi:predicted MFS family arabinose efflux permease
MAAMMALPLLTLLGFREPDRDPGSGATRHLDYAALARFFRRPGAGWWALVLVLYRAGDGMAITMLKPMLVDHGIGLAPIGLIVGLGSSIAALSGALVGSAVIGRLGRSRALLGLAAFHGLAVLSLSLLARSAVSLPAAWLASAAVAFAGGMATTALYTHMMDRSSRRTGGTDFTLQQSLAAIGPLIGAGLSGWSAQSIGYSNHFLVCALVSVAAAALVWKAVPERSADPVV